MGSEKGWIELDLVEGRDLIGAISDPYVRVKYGQLKKKSKVIFTSNFKSSF